MFPYLMQFCKCLHDRLRAELEPKGIYRGQGRILHILKHQDSVSQVDIAKNLMLRRATVTRMLQRMERDGLIERFRDPDDERIIRVRLTAAGSKAESLVMEVRAGIEAAIDAALTKEEQILFRALLKQVTDVLSPGGSWTHECSINRGGPTNE